jgi:hypothetical protein
MIDTRNFHFRLAFIGDCTSGLLQTAAIDTDGYTEAIWFVIYDLDLSGAPQPSVANLALSGSANQAMQSPVVLWSAGETLNTDGSVSTLPGDKDLRVISVATPPDADRRRWQRLVGLGFLDGGAADVMKAYVICALRHDGQYSNENELVADTGGEAFEITSEGLIR